MPGARAGKLMFDQNKIAVQVFAPNRMVSLAEDEVWTPNKYDICFRTPEDVSYAISGGTEVLLGAGSVTGVVEGKTYTFAAATVIEVM